MQSPKILSFFNRTAKRYPFPNKIGTTSEFLIREDNEGTSGSWEILGSAASLRRKIWCSRSGSLTMSFNKKSLCTPLTVALPSLQGKSELPRLNDSIDSNFLTFQGYGTKYDHVGKEAMDCSDKPHVFLDQSRFLPTFDPVIDGVFLSNRGSSEPLLHWPWNQPARVAAVSIEFI